MREGSAIGCIRAAVADGRLSASFTPAEVNAICGITWAGAFLPKHRGGNPGGNTEFFVRVSSSPARYRLA